MSTVTIVLEHSLDHALDVSISVDTETIFSGTIAPSAMMPPVVFMQDLELVGTHTVTLSDTIGAVHAAELFDAAHTRTIDICTTESGAKIHLLDTEMLFK